MNDSILNTIKPKCGVAIEDEAFDEELILYINATFSILDHLGVGPVGGFTVESVNDTWDDYMDDEELLNIVKPYVSIKVKIDFDPPQSGIITETYNKIISEYEWRLNAMAEERK